MSQGVKMKKKFIVFYTLFLLTTLINCGSNQEEGLRPPKGMVNLDFKNDKKTYKLLIMDSQNKDPYKSARVNLLSTLKKFGLIKNKNLNIKYYDIKNKTDKAIEILKREIPSYKPDVIFTNGTVMARAARKAFVDKKNVKFVFACVSDPIGEKLIKDFGVKPIHNFTGVSYPVAVKARFEFIKRVFPNVRKIAILSADMPQSKSYTSWVKKLFETDPQFKGYKVIFQKVELVTGKDSQEKMTQLMKPHVLRLNDKVDLFVSGNDQLGISDPLAKMMKENSKKPFVPLSQKPILKKIGGIAVIYPSSASMGVQAGYMIMKLFKGINIKNIPGEQPKKNGVAFNLIRAEKWGVKIPTELIELAGKNIVK